jgi:hypothetical protein
VDQPAETVGSLDTVPAFEPARTQVGDRLLEVGPAVRSLVVVVTDELPEHPVEMAFSADERPVQALGPRCADKAFGESVRPRRPDRGADDPGADRAHHLVKRPDELRIAVTDKEAEGSRLIFQGGGQVPGLWGNPGPDRVGRHAGQEDLTSLQVNEEQDVEPSPGDRVEVEEVAAERAGGTWARRKSDHEGPEVRGAGRRQ